MLVVLQGDLGAGGGRELASADEITQCEDQLLELVCRRLEEVRREPQEAWQNGTSVSPAGRSWC